MGKTKELERQLEDFKAQLNRLKEEKEALRATQDQEIARLKEAVGILENTLRDKDLLLAEKARDLKQLNQLQASLERYEDPGYLTLEGFKLVPPYLDKVIGRPFMITISQEFNYLEALDRENLQIRYDSVAKGEGPGFHSFRDQFKPGYSFRTVYTYSTKEYFMNTPKGKLALKDFMLPPDLVSGVEISSQFKSAMYLSIHNKSLQSAVLPEQVFGAPLLSYAFPILDKNGVPLGAVSFSNDISQIVNIAKSLGNIVSSNSDEVLSRLAKVLKEELQTSQDAALKLKDESVSAKKIAETIRQKGRQTIEIAERLKVLALNTAIEATKVGKNGKGVGVISEQMRHISESTRKSLQEIYKFSQSLFDSSNKVFDTSAALEESARSMREESSVLFDASIKITTQKDDLAALVRMSIDEIAQNQDDLNKIFMLLK